MAIELYTGTPGSGKSYHAARRIVAWLKRGKPLIANFPVNEKAAKEGCIARAEYLDNSELSASYLVKYAFEHLKIGVEHQCLVVIDECQVIFNCREFGRSDRMAWVQLFSQHRKLGFDFLLITQSDRMMDKQIRYLVETEVKHRKLNNYGFGGGMLSLLTLGSTWFIAMEYWYGGNKLLLSRQVFRYQKKYEKVYDSYRLFTDMLPGGAQALAGDCAGGDPEGVGPRGTAPAEGSAPTPAQEGGGENVASTSAVSASAPTADNAAGQD